MERDCGRAAGSEERNLSVAQQWRDTPINFAVIGRRVDDRARSGVEGILNNLPDGEREQGRMFTICKHRWLSGCLVGVEGIPDNLPDGEREQGRVFAICNPRWQSACLANGRSYSRH